MLEGEEERPGKALLDHAERFCNLINCGMVNLRQTCFREGIQAGAQRILRKSGCKE
jgi:hypothetical protein